MYDPVDLRLHLAVLDEGSITAGAARLPLSLPSASARLRALEDRAGVALFVRGRRGVRPTPAGLAFARHAREVLDGLRRLEGAVAAYGGPARRTVRLVAGSSAMHRLVPRSLATLLTAQSDVDVVCVERRSTDALRLLDDGDADLGVVIAARVGGTVDPDDHLADDSLVVVGAADGVLAGSSTVRFEQVAEHPMVGLTPESPLELTLSAELGERAPLARHRARTVGMGSLLDLAEAGVGLAVVPRHVVGPRRRLAVCELAEPWARRALVLHRAPEPAAGTEDLAAHLRSAAREDVLPPASVYIEGRVR